MIKFWQKDFINKLIVLTGLLIISALGLVIYLLTSTAPGTTLLAKLYPTPTMSVQELFLISGATATAKSVNATASVFPTWTTAPFTPVVKSPTPSATPAGSQSSVAIAIGTHTPTATETEVPGVTLSPTASLTPTRGPTVSSNSTSVACLPAGPIQTGTVINVINSSTVQVLINDLVYSVRYIGLIPPTDPVFVQGATFANGELVFGKQVTLISDKVDADSGGSLLRYVLVESTLANLEMLKQGHAALDPAETQFYCLDTFQAAENEARTAKKGIWK